MGMARSRSKMILAVFMMAAFFATTLHADVLDSLKKTYSGINTVEARLTEDNPLRP